MTTTKLQFNLEEITIRERQWGRSRALMDSPAGPSRVFVEIKDESILENLVERRSRPFTEWKPFVEVALKAKGIDFEKLSWSQKAGCTMCPCSPGFIVRNGDIGRDIWLTIGAK